MTAHAGLDDLISRVRVLPHMPHALVHLISVVSDPQSTVDEIVAAVRFDQTLTAEVLRLCNSAYYALSRRVESLDDAVCLLGTVRVLQLVMAAHSRSLLGRAQEGYGLAAEDLWLHSVGVALAAQHLARRLQLNQSGLLFTAGLLHDAGKIVLNEFVQREYAEIARLVSEEGQTFPEAERRVLGYTHAEVGGRLAERWQLPDSIGRCSRYHHEPEVLDPPDPVVDAIYVADSICILLGVGAGDDGLAYRAAPAVLRRCGLQETDLESIGAEMIGELRQVQAVFVGK